MTPIFDLKTPGQNVSQTGCFVPVFVPVVPSLSQLGTKSSKIQKSNNKNRDKQWDKIGTGHSVSHNPPPLGGGFSGDSGTKSGQCQKNGPSKFVGLPS